jgi:hypothetical protein
VMRCSGAGRRNGTEAAKRAGSIDQNELNTLLELSSKFTSCIMETSIHIYIKYHDFIARMLFRFTSVVSIIEGPKQTFRSHSYQPFILAAASSATRYTGP